MLAGFPWLKLWRISYAMSSMSQSRIVSFLVVQTYKKVCSRIDPYFIKHDFNVILDDHLVKQRRRRFVPDHVDVVIEEVDKLKEASSIIDILYLK